MIHQASEGFRQPDDFQQLSQYANRLPVTAPRPSAAWSSSGWRRRGNSGNMVDIRSDRW